MVRLGLSPKARYRMLHTSQQSSWRASLKLDDFAFSCQLTIQTFTSGVTHGPWAKNWSALSVEEKAAATALGFGTEEMWANRMRDGPDDMTT